jgi:preprotein translocase subunit SecF
MGVAASRRSQNLVLTATVYLLLGFEITPSTVIGFLTILGFALYDVVVVFDKVRENTRGITGSSTRTYGEAANLAVNQTLMRSINTAVVALLPVGGLLFIGAGLLGAGTLKDLGLVLFVGMLAAVYSSIFLATPVLVDSRREPPVHKQRVLRGAPRRQRQRKARLVPAPVPVAVSGVGGRGHQCSALSNPHRGRCPRSNNSSVSGAGGRPGVIQRIRGGGRSAE